MRIGRLADLVYRLWDDISPEAEDDASTMMELTSCDSTWGDEDGHVIVARFLDNAAAWQGHNAEVIKAELRRQLEEHRTGRDRYLS